MSLEDRYAALIARIAGLTDPELLEQCGEEARELEAEIETQRVINASLSDLDLTDLETKKSDAGDDPDLTDLMNESKYAPTDDLIEALEITNKLYLKSEIDRKRLRVPVNFDQDGRRLLTVIAREFNVTILVTDLNGFIDEQVKIGSGPVVLQLFVNGVVGQAPVYVR
jgi:hypothetical protein